MNPDLALVIVSDVDGTMLDDDFSASTALKTVTALERHGVPLVLCSSKTRAEVECLQRILGLSHPFIVENGTALYVPDGYFPFEIPSASRLNRYEVVPFARPYPQVVAALHRAAEDTGVEVRGFSDMSVREISSRSGLAPEMAALAKQREGDEPFHLVDDRPENRGRLLWALQQAGVHVLRGGLFDHAVMGADKGIATAFVGRLYRNALGPVTIVGLGDALNDVGLLRSVDLPFIVRSTPDVTSRVHEQVPCAEVTLLPGPEGWQSAVYRVLEERLRKPTNVDRAAVVKCRRASDVVSLDGATVCE